MGDRRLAAIGMRLAATFFLTAMFALAKLAQERGVHLIEILFFRQAFMVPPVVAIVAFGPGLASLRTRRPGAHVSRTATGLAGMALNFLAVGLLPLAEVQSIWFTIPLFATMLGAVVLGEHVGAHRWGAVLVGFVGVLIVIQPQSGHLPLGGAIAALSSAVMVAITSVLVRQLGQTEPSLTTVFWFGTISSVVLIVPLLWVLRDHDAGVWALLLAMGLVGSLGQIALTFSLRFAPVSVVAPVDYAGLIWATLFGALLFGTWPTPWTWIGAPVIVASGLYIVWRERRLARAVTTLAAPD